MAALKHDEQNVREEAIQFLQPHETELFKYLRYMERREGPEDNEDGRETFKRIAKVYRADAAKKLLENISFTQQEKGKLLLAAPRILEARWEAGDFPNHDNLLPVILATVNHEDPEVSAQANLLNNRQDYTHIKYVRLLNSTQIQPLFYQHYAPPYLRSSPHAIPITSKHPIGLNHR